MNWNDNCSFVVWQQSVWRDPRKEEQAKQDGLEGQKRLCVEQKTSFFEERREALVLKYSVIFLSWSRGCARERIPGNDPVSV